MILTKNQLLEMISTLRKKNEELELKVQDRDAEIKKLYAQNELNNSTHYTIPIMEYNNLLNIENENKKLSGQIEGLLNSNSQLTVSIDNLSKAVAILAK